LLVFFILIALLTCFPGSSAQGKTDIISFSSQNRRCQRITGLNGNLSSSLLFITVIRT